MKGFSVSPASVVYHAKASTTSHYINYPPIDSRQRPETGILNSLGLLLKQTVVYSSNLTDTYRNCINTCIGLGGLIRDFVTQRTKKKEAFFCLHILSRQRLVTGSKSLGLLLKHIMHGLHFKQTMYRKCTNICIGLD